jgi:hypothetical protein
MASAAFPTPREAPAHGEFNPAARDPILPPRRRRCAAWKLALGDIAIQMGKILARRRRISSAGSAKLGARRGFDPGEKEGVPTAQDLIRRAGKAWRSEGSLGAASNRILPPAGTFGLAAESPRSRKILRRGAGFFGHPSGKFGARKGAWHSRKIFRRGSGALRAEVESWGSRRRLRAPKIPRRGLGSFLGPAGASGSRAPLPQIRTNCTRPSAVTSQR